MKKTGAQLDAEIAEFLTEAPPAGARGDVTAELLRDASFGPGDDVKLVATAKAAKSVAATPSLAATLANLRARSDRTMGFISKALAYSKAVREGGKREHANLIRLIKGGYVRVCEMRGAPPSGSVAHRDSPYGDRYYVLHIGRCGD